MKVTVKGIFALSIVQGIIICIVLLSGNQIDIIMKCCHINYQMALLVLLQLVLVRQTHPSE